MDTYLSHQGYDDREGEGGPFFLRSLSAWPISIFRRFLRNLSAKLADRRLLTERRSVGPIARDIQGRTTMETRKGELIARVFFVLFQA